MSRAVVRNPVPQLPEGLSPRDAQTWALSLEIYRAFDSGDASGAEAAIAALERLAPGDAKVAEYRKVAAVVGFECAAARAPYEPQPRTAPPSENVELVAFHADLPHAPSGIHARTDYLGVLAQAFRAAAANAPRARRVLITDARTAVAADCGAQEIVRLDLDTSRLMYERMRAQELYLERRAPGLCSVLMDVDVVVNHDPAQAFAEDFDIGLTYRPESKDAPFNGGVILAGAGAGALAFLRKARACYDALADSAAAARYYPGGLRAWWGDQFALYAAVGQRAFCTREAEGQVVDGVRVAFFPCAQYNYTLGSPQEFTDPALRSKPFLHFKGNRKAWLGEYLAALQRGF
jgi:hypothetical protein